MRKENIKADRVFINEQTQTIQGINFSKNGQFCCSYTGYDYNDIKDSNRRDCENKKEQSKDTQQKTDEFGIDLSKSSLTGIITHKGTIVDATFVDAPRQRNSRDENRKIKNGEIPEEWEKTPYKKLQKDTEARWTKKVMKHITVTRIMLRLMLKAS